jgi:AcrR family transcriptional regulator
MGLDRERIVRTGLRLLGEVGLEGLTLRRLARELDVQAPTLYWHVKSKQELLDEMATAMLRDLLAEGEAPPGPWPEFVTGAARGLRRMLLAYRDGARVFSGTHLTDDSLIGAMEQPLRRLTEAGFSLDDAARGWSAVYSYVIGSTIEEQAVHPSPGARDERYDPERRALRIDADRHPLAAAAGPALFGDFDDRFEHGLALLVAGMARALDD